jgi:deazaflavin-dependent oxidoreductase (nitroreductase family)
MKSSFWLMNRLVNPVMRVLLRSPLHGLLSDSLLLLTYRGKKSGKQYTLPVQYARIGQTFYIVPGLPDSKVWWRNLTEGAPVDLWVRGEKLAAQAQVVSGKQDEGDWVDSLLAYFTRFPAAAQAHGLRRSPDGSPDRDEVRSAVPQIVVVQATVKPNA